MESFYLQNFRVVANWDKVVKTLLTVVAVVVVLVLVFFGGMGYQHRVSSVTEQYLQDQIEKAEQEAGQWKERYEASLEEKTTLLLNVDSLESEVKKLKKNYGQKVTIVNSYTNPELEQFFAERYGTQGHK